jgi:hypothetical protein
MQPMTGAFAVHRSFVNSRFEANIGFPMFAGMYITLVFDHETEDYIFGQLCDIFGLFVDESSATFSASRIRMG